MYALHAPTLAFVPWPQTFHHWRRIKKWPPGRPRRPVERYYLKPLTEEVVARLVSRPLRAMPFLEDYTGPWGWRCISPFWYTRMSSLDDVRLYARLLAGFWRNGEAMFPRMVTVE